MALKLNNPGYEHARRLVEHGRVVRDARTQWSEHHPSTQRENEFIDEHGVDEFARWYLAVDDQEAQGTKGRYKFPYGDFARVHRCAILSAEVRAGQYKHEAVELAAAHLHGMVDEAG